MSKIGIINCGMGNLTSVRNSFISIGLDCDLVDDANKISGYEKLVLPGVGAFHSMVKQLKEKDFSIEIHNHIKSGKPFLGICLGMQVLFDSSSEFEETEGLSILRGKVQSLPNGHQPVPNVGWWGLKGNYGLFSKEISANDTFYFVHSYFCKPTEDYDTLTIEFNGTSIVVAIREKNIFGYQFHPEKSQVSGQKLLRSFNEAS